MKRGIMLALLVLAACTTQTTQPEPQDYRSGTEALRMNFLPNLPPTRIYDTEQLNVMLNVENVGTHTLGPNDKIYLSGFDPTLITGIPTTGKPLPILAGRGPYITQGGYDTITFQGKLASLTSRRIDRYEPTILATACYSYETIATATICIDPNPYSATLRDKICTPSTVSTGSQGAPIAVTSVEVEPSPGKTRFKITIQNAGSGQVYKNTIDAINRCNPYAEGLRIDEIDNVQLKDISIGGTTIHATCKPQDNNGYIRLTNGQATIHCEYALPPAQNPYVTPISVTLGYGYRQSSATRVEIRAT